MGECGCGELNPIAKLPKANGIWYLLEVYPGCTYCGTSWGLGVTWIAEDSEEWEWFKDTPTLEFDRYQQWGTTILDIAVLRQQFKLEEGGEDDLGEVNFALEEFVSHGGLQRVFDETRRAVEALAAHSEPAGKEQT